MLIYFNAQITPNWSGVAPLSKLFCPFYLDSFLFFLTLWDRDIPGLHSSFSNTALELAISSRNLGSP